MNYFLNVDSAEQQKMIPSKVTIYQHSAFGMDKIEATLIEYGEQVFAQYQSVPFIVYIKNSCRKRLKQIISGDKPLLLILEGFNHPDPDSSLTPDKIEERAGFRCIVKSCLPSMPIPLTLN